MFAIKPFNVLIACEESQTTCKVFREFGCNAFAENFIPFLNDLYS